MLIKFLPLVVMISLSANAYVEEWVIFRHVHPIRQIQGIVEYPDGSPAVGIVVELYDNPDAIVRREAGWEQRQRKIAGVITDPKGRFMFAKVRSGKYEVRVKSDPHTGANQTSVIVRVFCLWPFGHLLRIRYTSFA